MMRRNSFPTCESVIAFWKKKKGYVPRHMLLLVPTNVHVKPLSNSNECVKRRLFKNLKSTINLRKIHNRRREANIKKFKIKILKTDKSHRRSGKADKDIESKDGKELREGMMEKNIEKLNGQANHATSEINDSVNKYEICHVDKKFILKKQKLTGYCYLYLFNAIEDKLKAYQQLGSFPSIHDVKKIGLTLNCNKLITYSSGFGRTVYHVHKCDHSSQNWNLVSKYHNADSILLGGEFEDVDLALEKISVHYMSPEIEFQRDGNYIKLKNSKGEDFIKKIEFENPNFIHDAVFSTIFQERKSDKALKGLTPDFWSDKIVFELATTTSSSDDDLLQALNKKLNKYKSISECKQLLIIVVSYDRVMSNYQIKEKFACALIHNFNVVKRLQHELQNEGKLFWTNSKESRFERKLLSILQNYKLQNKMDDKKLSLDIIDSNWDNYNYMESLKEIVAEISDFIKQDIFHPHYICEKKEEIVFNEEGRKDLKRITIVPMVCPEVRNDKNLIEIKAVETIIPSSKFKIIQESKSVQEALMSYQDDMSLQEILSGFQSDLILEKGKPKKDRKPYQFKPEFTPSELLELNMDGIMAKENKSNPMVQEKRARSKIPFSSSVDTKDIEEFRLHFRSLLTETVSIAPKDQNYGLMNEAYSSITDANVNLIDQGKDCIRQYRQQDKLKLMNWLNFISDLMFEINLSLRENTKNGYFIVKSLRRYQADVFIKTTKSSSHIFFFLICKPDYILSNTLGPKFACKDGVLVTEWGSMLKRDLENFLNIKDTIKSTFECYDEVFSLTNHEACLNAKWISLMILLNNKDRNEEIISSLRYTYMKSLSITENPSQMNAKLNLLFRDRLQVYLTKKVFDLNKDLSAKKPSIVIHLGELHVNGLMDMFNSQVDLKQAINISYAGYVMTKIKQPQSNQSSKMIEKILDYELKFLNVQPQEISKFKLYHSKPHCFDYGYVRTFSEIAKQILSATYDKYTDDILKERVLKKLQLIELEDLATLKASAKIDLKGEYSKENFEKLKSSRPRVAGNIVKLISKFDPEHFIDLIQPCIKHLVKNDSFNVELFPKDQHNGLREIYVVDIHARIVQLFLETISRSICSFFQSETLNHPKNSSLGFSKSLKQTLENVEKPFCLMKSGDASKWSQSQVVSKFYIVLKTFLPKEFHLIVKDSLSLWFDKKIFLPPQLIESFMNTEFKTTNEVLNSLREGKLTTIKKNEDMYMRVKSGFMQGILHHTSSLFHTIVQEGFRQIQFKILQDYFANTKHSHLVNKFQITILQGSDDSSMSIAGDARTFNDHKELFFSLMHLKDKFSFKFGIIPSIEKTATCVPFIVEYNSQWLSLGKNIQPTIKFAMVSCQIPSSQSLIQRQEFYYNLLKDCLEKGCSTLTCFKIKLCQLSSFYNMLGSNNTSSFEAVKKLLIECLNPSLGFFILEPIVATAVFGFDFSFFCHMQGSLIKFLPTSYLNVSETNIPTTNTLRINTHITKTNAKKWQQLLEEVGELTDEDKEFLEKNPVIYYEKGLNDTYSSVLKIKDKCKDFDVMLSLSSRYGITENMASFFCTFAKVCKIGKEKDSLCGWLVKCTESGISDLAQMFPRLEFYKQILDYIGLISDCSYLVDAEFVQRNKSQVTVLKTKTAEHELLLETIKFVWFDLESDEVTKSAYKRLFKEFQEEFPWLKNTEKETKENLSCSSRQLANYLRDVVGKNRTLTFYDTVAKGSNYSYLITRIFQKGKKLKVIKRNDNLMDKNDVVFSNLKILLNLPYEHAFKEEIMPKLINQLELDNLSKAEKTKYKLLKLLLSGDESSYYNELFKYSFENQLSWFSKAQDFNKIDKSWTGEGSLTTIIYNLTIVTKIQDDYISEIIVNDIEAFKLNLEKYYKVIKDHKLKFSNDEGDFLKISKYGMSNMIKGTRLTIDYKLWVSHTALKNSKVIMTNGNMKIMVPMICDDFSMMGYMTTLYQVEVKRKAKNFEERKTSNSQGYIFEHVWINKNSYQKAKHGEVLKERQTLRGKDVKFTTLLNFEIWKKITSPSDERLFPWGEIGTMIVNQETISPNDYVKGTLNKLPKSLPIQEMFNYIMKENRFDKDDYLNFVSRVEFLTQISDPDYDELVKKDAIENVDFNLIEEFNFLLMDTNKLKKSIAKTLEFDSLLTNLGSVIENSQNDFVISKYTIYGIKDTETTFPNSMFYQINIDLRNQVPNEDELLNLLSKGDDKNLLTLEQKIYTNLLFNTPLQDMHVNTVKSLREYYLIGYIPKSTRSSRSSARLGLHVPESDLEHEFLKRFRFSIKNDNFQNLINQEEHDLIEAIKEISVIADSTSNKRVKFPLITQIVALKEDLEILNKYKIEVNTSQLKEKVTKIIQVDDESYHDDKKTNSLENSSQDGSLKDDDESQANSDDLSQTIESEGGSFTFDDYFNLFEHLSSTYAYNLEIPITHLHLYFHLNYYDFITSFDDKPFRDWVKDANVSLYENDVSIYEVEGLSVIYYTTEDTTCTIFSFKEIMMTPEGLKLLDKKIHVISPSPGGSCLFNAISTLLKNKNKHYSQEELRQIVANSSHNLDFDIENERLNMTDNNVWGGEIEIEILAHELNVSIDCVMSHSLTSYNSMAESIGVIINHHNVHFDVLM
nr:RNA-dependent RNA polymerase [Grapevine Muscat rose virus]